MHGKAKEQAEIDGEKEIVETSTIQAMGKNKYGNVTQNELEEKLNSNAGDGKTEVIDDGDTLVVKFVDSGRYYEVDGNGNVQYLNAKTTKTITIKCYDSPTNIINEKRYIVIGNTYSKKVPNIDGYEPEQETIEGSILEDTTIEIKYYKICNDDTTLIFKGLNSSGNETTTSSEIVSYKVTGICESVDANKYLSIRIPEKYRNFQVTMIESKAFYNLNNIYKVIIPDTITKYGSAIFAGNTNLKYAEINGSGSGYYNFTRCTNLEKVVLGNGVALNLRWFSGCTNLREVILNGKISIINTDYFEYCDNLTTITLAQENKSYKFIMEVSKMQKILIIEDDEKLREELETFLNRNGFIATSLKKFDNAVADILEIKADLLLIDINLPYTDGEFICKEIRKTSNVPIIMVTSRDNEIDELLSLNYGADQYVTKPYNIQILLAKIVGLLKRNQNSGNNPDKIDCGSFILNTAGRIIEKEDKKIELTKNEYKILEYLVLHRQQVISRDEIMDYLWEREEFVDDNTLNVNIKRLRTKLEELGIINQIETRRGQGYILK